MVPLERKVKMSQSERAALQRSDVEWVSRLIILFLYRYRGRVEQERIEISLQYEQLDIPNRMQIDTFTIRDALERLREEGKIDRDFYGDSMLSDRERERIRKVSGIETVTYPPAPRSCDHPQCPRRPSCRP